MKEITWTNSLKIADPEELSTAWQQLCTAAQEAMQNAYAPYSKYQVGAAALLSNGDIIKGSNQENAVYPLGICAERVALATVGAQHPGAKVKALAICTNRLSEKAKFPAFPCGSCRQTIIESEMRQGDSIPILITDDHGQVYIIQSVKDILPFAFDEGYL